MKSKLYFLVAIKCKTLAFVFVFLVVATSSFGRDLTKKGHTESMKINVAIYQPGCDAEPIFNVLKKEEGILPFYFSGLEKDFLEFAKIQVLIITPNSYLELQIQGSKEK